MAEFEFESELYARRDELAELKERRQAERSKAVDRRLGELWQEFQTSLDPNKRGNGARVLEQLGFVYDPKALRKYPPDAELLLDYVHALGKHQAEAGKHQAEAGDDAACRTLSERYNTTLPEGHKPTTPDSLSARVLKARKQLEAEIKRLETLPEDQKRRYMIAGFREGEPPREHVIELEAWREDEREPLWARYNDRGEIISCYDLPGSIEDQIRHLRWLLEHSRGVRRLRKRGRRRG